MSFFASLPTVAVPVRRFDTFVDVLTSPDRSTFRIAIRRLEAGTKNVVAAIISPSYPINAQTAPAYAAAMAFGGSLGRNRTQPQIDAALRTVSRAHPAAIEVHSWRTDGDLPAWETQRERNFTPDNNLSALTGATPAAGASRPPVFGHRADDAAPIEMTGATAADTESVPFN